MKRGADRIRPEKLLSILRAVRPLMVLVKEVDLLRITAAQCGGLFSGG